MKFEPGLNQAKIKMFYTVSNRSITKLGNKSIID